MKKLKNIIVFIALTTLCCLGFFSIIYTLTSFIEFDFNIANWGKDARGVCAVFSFFCLLISVIVVAVNTNKD